MVTRVGINGFGRIGKSLIKRCNGFEMKVNVYDPFVDESVIKKLDKGVFVKKGESICILDPENRTAALDEAVASKNKAQLQYDAIKQLADEGYRSENAVATAECCCRILLSNTTV